MISSLKDIYPLQNACKPRALTRSSYYYHPVERKENQRLQQAIQTLAGE